MADDELVVSERLNEIFQFAEGELESSEWYRRVHPDDAPAYRAALRAHFRRQTPKLECEYRILDGKGRYRWVLDHAIGVRDEGGRVVRMVGAVSDINALIQNCLDLAYHGERARNPRFNITLERDLDPAAGAAEVYAQELSRVFINLFSNSFYATSRRAEAEGEGYQPLLTVRSGGDDQSVRVHVRDNGTGIPPAVRDKLFSPFFTTKPAGEGTGLGLSLSYDIVVQGHGGAIDVESEKGAFTEFLITLPRTARAAATDSA